MVPSNLPPPSSLLVVSPKQRDDQNALAKLQEQRESLLTSLSEAFTPEDVKKVMTALKNAAVGFSYIRMNKDGKEVTLSYPPDVAAAKLYLAYAVGSADTVGAGDKKTDLLNLTPEQFASIARIAARFGKELSNVRVKDDVIDVEGRVVQDEPNKQTQGSQEEDSGGVRACPRSDSSHELPSN